jgi:hypothetical protein
MKKNVGSIDQWIRIGLGLVLIILFQAHVVAGVWGIVLLVLAIILLLTAIFNFCPLYLIFKCNTNKKKKARE